MERLNEKNKKNKVGVKNVLKKKNLDRLITKGIFLPLFPLQPSVPLLYSYAMGHALWRPARMAIRHALTVKGAYMSDTRVAPFGLSVGACAAGHSGLAHERCVRRPTSETTSQGRFRFRVKALL